MGLINNIINNIKNYIYTKRIEKRAVDLESLLLSAGVVVDTITKEQALNIPSVAGCLNIIANTVATIPIKLYKESDGKVTEILKDNRLKLFNDDTKDILDGTQLRKAILEDYLLKGAAYVYLNKERNNVKSINYVDNNQVCVNVGVDPIFKTADILVYGKQYRDFEFLKITRKSKDGVTGTGLIAENNKILSVAYNSIIFEEVLVKSGGNKKGFIKAEGKLDPDAMALLKAAWNNMYKNNTENVIVLNNGLDFKEASNTSTEMQLNENKITNATEICKIFNVPVSLLEGKATEEEYNTFVKVCIVPILKAIEAALNKDLLLEVEKDSYYFSFDTKELLKGDIEKRYRAYSEAVKSGWVSKNEIRYLEDMEPIEGLDVVTMSQGDVIFDINTKKYFMPNTVSTIDSKTMDSSMPKGGE